MANKYDWSGFLSRSVMLSSNRQSTNLFLVPSLSSQITEEVLRVAKTAELTCEITGLYHSGIVAPLPRPQHAEGGYFP